MKQLAKAKETGIVADRFLGYMCACFNSPRLQILLVRCSKARGLAACDLICVPKHVFPKHPFLSMS